MMNLLLLRRGSAKSANLLASVLAAFAFACAPADRAPTTAFRGPTGMALAGQNFDKVYVANSGTDTLQVVLLTGDMRRIDLSAAPARYFPLNIPSGPNPQDVAASPDGRYVFVLDQITSTVRLIDADAESLVRGSDGQPLTLPLGPSDVEASSMVASPWACSPSEANPNSTCAARVYVGLRRLNAVAAVDVRVSDQNNTLSMVIDSTMAIGAAPVRMAAHPGQPALFITDAGAPDVVRLSLQSNAGLTGATLSRFALGVPGGAIAVSGDGQVLAVARPAYQDVALFGTSGSDVGQGTLVALDANPLRTPLPSCITPCRQADLGICADAHPADSALCSDTVGYGNAARPYMALYLGSMPTALTPLDANVTGTPLVERCVSKTADEATAFSQAFAVATIDGTIQYIGITPNLSGAPSARILDRANCDAPTIKSLDGPDRSSGVLDKVLAPCAPLPAGRARMACLKDVDGDDIGRVGIMRGLGDLRPVGLVWEGVLPNGDRSGGGGMIDAQGRLYDASTDSNRALEALPIRARELDAYGNVVFRGDVVQILTPQLVACGQGTNSASICELERRVIAVQMVDNHARLQLDVPLRAACFNEGVQLAYRIRAGDAFLAGPITEGGVFIGAPSRLNPGDTYGAGKLAGATAAVFFTIDPALDIGADLSACQRYMSTDEVPAQGMPTWRSRKHMTKFVVQDPYDPLRSGLLIDPFQQVPSNRGQMPFAMVMTRKAPQQTSPLSAPPLLLVSFAGSDGILITSPLEAPSGGGNEPKERMLQ